MGIVSYLSTTQIYKPKKVLVLLYMMEREYLYQTSSELARRHPHKPSSQIFCTIWRREDCCGGIVAVLLVEGREEDDEDDEEENEK